MATRKEKPKQFVSFVISGTIEVNSLDDMKDALDQLDTLLDELRGNGSATAQINIPEMEVTVR